MRQVSDARTVIGIGSFVLVVGSNLIQLTVSELILFVVSNLIDSQFFTGFESVF